MKFAFHAVSKPVLASRWLNSFSCSRRKEATWEATRAKLDALNKITGRVARIFVALERLLHTGKHWSKTVHFHFAHFTDVSCSLITLFLPLSRFVLQVWRARFHADDVINRVNRGLFMLFSNLNLARPPNRFHYLRAVIREQRLTHWILLRTMPTRTPFEKLRAN